MALLAIGGILFYRWLERYSDQALAAAEAEKSKPSSRDKGHIQDWEPLFAAARAVLYQTIASFPEKIQAEADRVPWTLQKWSDQGVLGLFTGYEDDRLSEGGNIQLFLGDIYLYCDEDMDDFSDEVRTTYLHELGHHLGWDEDDLEARGLG